MKKGLFIVIEGIDGSGKGTQSKLLCKWLNEQGFNSVLTMEPTDGIIGNVLRKCLENRIITPAAEALLFAADRVEHTDWIESKTQNGSFVVCDRYLQSSLAYQGAHGIDLKWITDLNRFAREPDLIIILDIDPKLALERVNSRGEKTDYFEKIDFLTKVRKIYLDQMDGFVIDASNSVEEVQESIQRVVRSFLKGS
jgi:dTMP kinase